MAIEINSEDELEMVAQTAMTGKGAEHLKEKFSQIVVEAVKVLNEDGRVNLEDVRIEKQKGESLEETSLIKGIVLDQERCLPDMPSVVEEAKIALIEEALEVRSPEMEAKINLSSPEQMQSFIAQEDKMLRNIVEQIKASGANVVFCQKGIDDVVQFYLLKEGIFAVRRVPKSDLQAISKAVGGRVISKLSELSSEDLGYARGVEEVREDDDGMIFITGCSNPRALTILVRGTSYHVMDEIERAIRDALGDVASILSDSLVLAGAGAVEMELSKELKSYAQGLSGREQLVVLEFAEAMEFVPMTLAENAGLDPIDVLTELRSAHDRGDVRAGINLFTNKVEDSFAAGILEPLKVKTQAISSATEVAIMILRIDDVIAAKKKGGASLKNAGAMAGYD
jgi:chaperonin GroEL (HSP60 family)